MEKDAPTPWIWDDEAEEIREGSRVVIAAKFVVQDRDASLLAAAPDLLTELEAICAEAESWHSVHGHTKDSVQCDSICKRIPTMRAAIHKARGTKSNGCFDRN